MSLNETITINNHPAAQKLNRGRVLLISPQPFFANRGSPLRLKSTIGFLTKNGFDVDILAFPFGEDLQMEGLTIERGYKIPGIRNVKIGISIKKLLLDIGLLFKAIRLSYSREYAAIHGVEEAAFIAALIGKLRKTPYLVDMHSDMTEQFVEHPILKNNIFLKTFNFFFNRCLDNSAGVITVCDEHTNKIGAAHNIPAFTARDLPLDCLEAFSAEKVLQIKNTLQLKNQKIVLYAGNLAPYQGAELLLRSFSKAISNCAVAACLIILGGGPEENHERERLIQLSKKLGCAEDVRFVRAVPVSQTRHYYALADLLVSPRLSGANTPLKIYSYLASNKPIVATNISSHTQVLSEECAYLCNTDEDDMAEKILAAFDSKIESITQRNTKLEKAKQMVDLQQWIADYELAINRLYGITPLNTTT